MAHYGGSDSEKSSKMDIDTEANSIVTEQTLTNDRGKKAKPSHTIGLPLISSLTNTPHRPRVDPGPRITGEFRTLSIHITETHEGTGGPSANRNVTELSKLPWHTLSSHDVCTRLGVSPKIGLDASMVTRRQKSYGKNVVSPPPRRLARRIFFYIFGGFGGLLFVASIICFISWKPLGEPNPTAANLALAVVLLIVQLIQAVFNAWQDFSTSRVMASIAKMLPLDVLVTRDGSTFKIPAAELVPGDLITLAPGSKVPADLRLIEVSTDLQFDRSVLTGESAAVSGTTELTDDNFLESKNIALQGTLIISGTGKAICVSIGDATVFGRIAHEAASERQRKTPLEQEIQRFVLLIAGMAFTVASLIVILWAAWLRRSYPDFINVPTLLIDCVSVAVAFIPEGLPVCVTLSLTVIAGAMRRSNVLCKSLSTVESLGAVDVICSDKTGTLTQNRMTVVTVAIGDEAIKVSEAQKELEAVQATGKGRVSAVRCLAGVAGLCNDAVFEESPAGEVKMPLEVRKVNGNATDVGLLRFAAGMVSLEPLKESWEELGTVTFNSKNKFAMKLFKSRCTKGDDGSPLIMESDGFDMDNGYLLLVKGAPEMLLRRCSAYIRSDGSKSPLDEKALANFTAIQEDCASQGHRVLLLAKRIITSQDFSRDPHAGRFDDDDLIALNSDLTIVGYAALVDPPREDVAETVRLCRGAGIRFAMVTGDFSITAASIARQIGIITTSASAVHGVSDLSRDTPMDQVPLYTPVDDEKTNGRPMKSLVLSGSELMTLNEVQWKHVMAYDEIIFARTSPQQKLQIVRAFQESGCTVAVTGDGVNDAPALRQADVGIAIAGGSEVATEAANLILLSDFSAIVTGIQYGRLCFENLRKSILYLLPAGSFSELMPVVVNFLFGLPQVLSGIQMIIICTATDVLPALSLINEKPEADLLRRRPRNRKTEKLVDYKLLLQSYAFFGVLESLTAMTGAFYFGFQKNGVPFSRLWLNYGTSGIDPELLAELTAKAQSIYFFNLVIMQWFNLLATRTRRLSIFQHNPLGGPKTRNAYLFPAMLAALAIGCFFSYVPWFQKVFGTRGVKVEYFFLPMAYGVVLLLLDEGRKYWNRKRPNSILAKLAW